MEGLLKWLPDADATPWQTLGMAMRAGLPVPSGFIVLPFAREERIRVAYEQIKIREKTHFVAVRGPSHAVLNVMGSDALIHALRRLSAESAEVPVLVQRMVHAMWCGKTHWHRKNLRIKANEGMMILDPDTYLINSATGKAIRRTLEPKQRKMIRHVDGSARVVEREGERTPMPAEHLAKIADLAVRVDGDIAWAVDDLDQVWLVSIVMRS
jgi:hypothetical protein